MNTEPDITLACVANIFSRQMHFKKAGDVEHGHTHPFDHLTLLAHGSLKVIIDGKESVFKAPGHIYIKAEIQHELEALEDDTVAYCIHALRWGNGVNDIIDPAMIPEGAKATELSKPVVGPNPLWEQTCVAAP